MAVTFAMLALYFRLYGHLGQDDEGLEEFILTLCTNRSVCKSFDELHDVESVS
ncbi:hypothetical protein PF010_g702 [Phytophthora fragariae]|uniref:Uncharacterized protein n=1 Tax=Phytophthora fragariae TaxID=53985 RepID=A0A6A4EYZ1_9STRA|nr:hypothetical protein PF009_g601 [Phytophthora fragariae]KAE9139141.1 hypothetical protein PF010_g702 [Phytophthora fragariae]KAE9329766.1 hypothetical protein PF001_g730 [Phytophthora fragariae]